MSIIGNLVKQSLLLKNRTIKEKGSNFEKQKAVLRKLMAKARHTQFGRAYDFDSTLYAMDEDNEKAFYTQFCKTVPIFSYNEMARLWWHKSLEGQHNVSWPGRVKYFALSSGTSEASTKHLPITRELIKANQKTSLRQILTLAHYNLPSDIFTTGVLMLGGSTKLNNHGSYYDGDLSGIQTKLIPTWFANFYKPGKKIASIPDWTEKLEEITLKARDWDIGVIAGSPAWLYILIEKIVKHYDVKSIHEIWPNLSIFAHGGVSFEPYKKGFEKLLSRPLIYLETYLASEGFIAYQAAPNHDMRLVLNNGLFLEFIPFNDENFTSDGDLVSKPKTLMIDEVELGQDYALILSSCAGAWRYMIGDVIRFSNTEQAEIKIIGRTKHYISLCGEHLSMENMDKALSIVMQELNIAIREYAVAGSNYGNQSTFTHHWYIGSDDKFDKKVLLKRLDEELGFLNDDYRVERMGPLAHLRITVLPSAHFYAFMKQKLGKEGGQNKFPRVLKKAQLNLWNEYLREIGLESEVLE
jgi:hypothetical protein